MFDADFTNLIVDKKTWDREFESWEIPMKLPIWADKGYTPLATQEEAKQTVIKYMTSEVTFIDKEVIYFDRQQFCENKPEADLIATTIMYFCDYLPSNSYWSWA